MRFAVMGLLSILLVATLVNYAYAATPQLPAPGASCPLFAESSFNSISPGVLGTYQYEDIGIAILALSLSFDTVAIAYMLSRIFPSLGIRNWLQNEYFEIVKTALIIVGIYLLLSFLSNVAFLVFPNVVPPFQSGQAFVSGSGYALNIFGLAYGAESYLCLINANFAQIWQVYGYMASGVAIMNSINVGYYFPIPLSSESALISAIQYSPFQNLMLQTGNFIISPFGSILNDIINFVLFPSSTYLTASIIMLPLLVELGLGIFIPLGIMFRAFPIIRGIGGTLIAIGIALSILYPSLLIMINYPITNAMTTTYPIQPTQLYTDSTLATLQPPAVGSVQIFPLFDISCGSFVESVVGAPINPGQIIFNLACSSIKAVSEGINDVAYSVIFNPVLQSYQTAYFASNVYGNIYLYLNYIIDYGVYIIIQLLLFVFDLIVLYSLTDSIAKSLGGTIRLQLGGKLKLA